MAVVNITTDNFEEEVINSDRKVLIDFWASWCGPCQMIGPVIEKVADEKEDIKVVKINVDEQGELAAKYKVMSIPTLIVLDKGKIINQSVGLISKSEIEELIS